MKEKIQNNKLTILSALLVLICMVFFTYLNWVDTDIFHLYYTGEYICKNGIPYENPFFVVEGYQTVIQQWLYDVILYKIGTLWGDTGFAFFTVIQLLSVYFLSVILLWNMKTNKKLSLFIPFFALGIMGYINIRPQMISIILLLVELICMEKYKNSKKLKSKILWLSIIPLTVIIEMNVHCTFWVFHLIFLMPYIFPYQIVPKSIRTHLKIVDTSISFIPFGVLMTLILLSAFINPYGLDGIMCMFNCLNSAINITEMNHMEIASSDFFNVLITWILYIIAYRKGKADSTATFFLLGTTILYIIVVRNSVFFFFGFLYTVSAFTKALNNELVELINSKLNEKFNSIKLVKNNYMYIIFVVVGTVCLTFPKLDSDLNTQLKSKKLLTTFTPNFAVDYIKEHEKNISELNVLSSYNSGSFFLYNGIGHVYIDAKAEPYFDKINKRKNILDEFVFLCDFGSEKDFDKFFSEYDFDYAFVEFRTNALQLYLDKSDKFEEVAVSEETIKPVKNYEVPVARLYKAVK